jgi:hypothetical protein
MPLFGENGSLNYLDKKRGELYRTLTDDYNKKIQALNTELTRSINENADNIETNTENIEAIEERLDSLGFNGRHEIKGTTYGIGGEKIKDGVILGYMAKMGKIEYGVFYSMAESDFQNVKKIDNISFENPGNIFKGPETGTDAIGLVPNEYYVPIYYYSPDPSLGKGIILKFTRENESLKISLVETPLGYEGAKYPSYICYSTDGKHEPYDQ